MADIALYPCSLFMCFEPTTAKTGTRDKVKVLGERWENHLRLHHPQDARDCGALRESREPHAVQRPLGTLFERIHRMRCEHGRRS